MDGLDLGLDAALGFDFDEVGPDRLVMSWTVAERHLQVHGIVHGGVYCSAVESSASIAANVWLGDRGRAVGVANHTNFLRPARLGERLTATATPVHRGRTQQLWQVDVIDSGGRLMARGEVRLHNLTT